MTDGLTPLTEFWPRLLGSTFTLIYRLIIFLAMSTEFNHTP